MGRTAKPTAIKVMEGNPGRRPLNDREPTPWPGAPEMPAYLDREARREWKRLVPILLGMRVLTEADGIALANLCFSYSLMVEAQKLMQEKAAAGKSALLVETPNGYAIQSPLLGIVNKQMQIISKQLSEFGLTPASRSRITTNAGRLDGMDPLEAALCG